MFSSGECVFETTFDAFTFDKPSVFGMFLQMYNSVLRQEHISARLEKKFDMLLAQCNAAYGVANITELTENDDILNASKTVSLGDFDESGKARYNITRAFGVSVSNGTKCIDNGDSDEKSRKLGPKLDTADVDTGVQSKVPVSRAKMGVLTEEGLSALTAKTDDITDESDPLFCYSPHNKEFRVAGKQLYLTYPQSGSLSREAVVKHAEKEFGSVDQYVISFERHKDGNHHIHAYIKFVDRVYRKGPPRWLDVDGHHPNIETHIRSLTAVIKYVIKGGDYISHNIDVGYLLSPEGRGRNGIRMKVATEALEGKSLVDIVDKHKSPLYGLLGLSRDLELYKQMKMDIELEHKPLREFSIAGIPFTFEGRHKEKQFWIVGPTNTGKTTIIESFMEQGYLGFELPTDDWWEGWHNKIGYVYAKEYHGGLTLMALNKFLEGGKGRHKLKIKGGTLWKTINVPVLIESNQYPHEVYHGRPRVRVDALAARLNIIELIPYPNGQKGYMGSRLLTENSYKCMLDEYYMNNKV